MSEIWLAETSGDPQPRRFTVVNCGRSRAALVAGWAQDRLLSDRAERGTAQVFVIDAAGGEARPLTSLRRGATDRLDAGRTVDHRHGRSIGTRRPAGSSGRDLPSASRADRPRVIVQVPVDGGEPKVMCDGARLDLDAWRGDGGALAAVTTGSNRLDDTIGNVRLSIIDVATHAERTLAILPFVPAVLQWSPNGAQLVMINETGDPPDDTRVILARRRGAATAAHWSPVTPHRSGLPGWGTVQQLLVLTSEGDCGPRSSWSTWATHHTRRLHGDRAGGRHRRRGLSA